MSEKCFMSNCSQEVLYICKCLNTETYCCKEHLSDHLSTPDQHAITPIFISINAEQRSDSLKKALSLLSKLKKVKASVRQSTNQIISSTIELSNRSLYQLKRLQSQLQQFLQNIFEGKMVRNKFLETIDTTFHTNLESFPNLHQSLAKFFEISRCQQNSEGAGVIFSKDISVGGLWSIDLETMKLSQLNYAPNVKAYGQMCRIDEEKYFFYGGQYGGKSVGDIFIVDFVKKEYQTLASGSGLRYSTLLFRNGKVYIFGGSNSVRVLNICKTFDLATGMWDPIPNLPNVCYATFADVLETEIIVTGYNLSKLYTFNNEEYSEVFDLPAPTYKVVSKGWVVIQYELFEYEYNIKNWISYGINWNNYHFWTTATFRRKQFIYFMLANNELWRIDTIRKRVEKVEYS